MQWRLVTVGIVAVGLVCAAVRAESSSTLLEKGVYYEETTGDLDAAIQSYKKVVDDVQANRKYAAEAQYRLGLCLLKKKQTEAAGEAFRKVVSAYPDQKDLVVQAQQNLANLGLAAGAVQQEDAPRIVSVFPAKGAQGVNPQTEIRVRFDRPMDPLLYNLRWRQGGFTRVGQIRYEEAQHEFVIPVRLMAGTTQRITLNEPSMGEDKGFASSSGQVFPHFQWEFKTVDGTDEPAAGIINPAGENSPQLLNLLQQVVEARAKVRSLVETVSIQRIQPQYKKPGYTGLAGEKAIFRIEGDRRFYGDVSTIMSGTFRIGCDGQTCWWHFLHPSEGPELTTCGYEEMNEKNVSVSTPFGTNPARVASLIQKRGLRYERQETIDGQPCHVIACRSDETVASHTSTTITRWWIDARTLQVVMVTTDLPIQDFPSPHRQVCRFSYERMNEDIPDSLFQVPQVTGVTAKPVEPLEEGYQKRFLNVIDGSQGRMSVRWGMRGTKGTSSSGLN